MTKIIILIILLFSTTSFSQSEEVGWTDLMETDITVGNNDYDIFTNGYGNHIIVKETSALKYYKMDVEGNTSSPTNLETSAVTSPSISGDVTRIYVVYRKGTESKIRTQYSNDGGANWSDITDLNLSGTPSSIECVFSKNKLHVTYQVGTVVYFTFYNAIAESWLSPLTVSNTGASNPRIGINSRGSVDSVYFVFNPGANRLSWRRYNVDDGLSSIKNMIIGGNNISHLGFAVDNEYIYAFFKFTSNSILNWHIRKIWNNSTISGGSNSNSNADVDTIFTTTTASGETCAAAWDKTNDTPPSPFRISRMRFNGNYNLTEDLIYQNQNLSPVNIVNLSAAGNDVHVVWKDNLGNNNGNNLRYKYYDDVPVPPQNLTIVKSQNNHPYLSWIDPQPDGSSYKIFRLNWCGGGWQQIATISDLYYEDESLSYCTAIPPAQCEEECTFHYKIKVVDVGNKESDYSNVAWARLVGGGKPSKIGANGSADKLEFEYSLSQNYPNPFNPTTQIDYLIKSAGFVSLNIYDMLGTEVVSLVNERKEPGHYSVEFNAANLPNGIYIYKLQADSFVDTKKMILLK